MSSLKAIYRVIYGCLSISCHADSEAYLSNLFRVNASSSRVDAFTILVTFMQMISFANPTYPEIFQLSLISSGLA